VAELVGADTDAERAIRWLIALMVLTCDPLAIALTAAASAHRFHQQSGSTPHDAGTIDPPPHRPPPFWLALARQRSRLHRRATPARSPTPNPLAQRTARAFQSRFRNFLT
jgi:hypothetical protein